MTRATRTRLAYVGLAVATIGIGFVVHRGGVPLSPTARDVSGDALWATMLTWWVGALALRRALHVRAAVALGLCVAVELGQLHHAPWLDAVRRTTLGHLVLGSDYDARDLGAYTLGVLGAVLLERWWRTRRTAG